MDAVETRQRTRHSSSSRHCPVEKIREAVLDGQWIHKGLRHGFATYYLNLAKDVVPVSYDMGNCPNVVMRYYARAIHALDWLGFCALTPGVVMADEPCRALKINPSDHRLAGHTWEGLYTAGKGILACDRPRSKAFCRSLAGLIIRDGAKYFGEFRLYGEFLLLDEAEAKTAIYRSFLEKISVSFACGRLDYLPFSFSGHLAGWCLASRLGKRAFLWLGKRSVGFRLVG